MNQQPRHVPPEPPAGKRAGVSRACAALRAGVAAILASGALTAGCEPRPSAADATSADADRSRPQSDAARVAPDVGGKPVASSASQSPRCAFRNVDFMVEPDLVLEVRRLVGELRVTGADPATFDDPRTFSVKISEAEVALDMDSLGAMMNHYVFARPDAPMRNLEVATDGKRLRISGTLHKGVPVPFSMLAEVSATPQGEIEIVPVELHAAGVPVRGLLDFFGIELEDLVSADGAVGVRVEENALYLQPRGILPPPRLDGKIVAVEVEGDRLVERFGGGGGAAVEPKAAKDGNTMTFRGGVLRFGHLTMEPTDLTLVDADPTDPFLFSIGDYVKHLIAGYSLTLADGSLVSVMPDYDQTGGPLTAPVAPANDQRATRAAGSS